MQYAWAVLSYVVYRAVTIFFYIISQPALFSEKSYWTRVLLFSLQFLTEMFLILRRIRRGVIVNVHTGGSRRNLPDFGRVFLMLKYTDITQNTYVQI
jgi:hypothetical protein